MQVIGADMFARWARVVGREDWIDDPRFATDLLRGDHYEQIADAMLRTKARECFTGLHRGTAELHHNHALTIKGNP